MSGALGTALADAGARGRGAARHRLPAIADRARARARRTRRLFLSAGAAVASALVALVIVTLPDPPPTGTPSSTPEAPAVSAISVGDLVAEARPRLRGEADALDQPAVVCDPGDDRLRVAVCDAVWVADEPLIDVSGTTLAVAEDGSARISWELRNVSSAELRLDLASVVVGVAGEGAPSEAPELAATVENATTVAAGGSWWASADRRYAPASSSGHPVALARGAVVSGTTELPAGAVAPAVPPYVLLQASMVSESWQAPRLILEGATGPLTSTDATMRLLDGALARTADDTAEQGVPALRCGPRIGEVDRVDDRWGGGYLWAPTCAPLWLTAPSLAVTTVRSDIDRSPFTRVVRWSASNASEDPLAVDLGATTVVLELDPAPSPHPARLWATSGDGFARIDTLWRAEGARTAAVRGPRSDVVLVQPGERVSGVAALHLPDGDEAELWGARLEHTRATVHLVLRTAGVGDETLVLELRER